LIGIGSQSFHRHYANDIMHADQQIGRLSSFFNDPGPKALDGIPMQRIG